MAGRVRMSHMRVGKGWERVGVMYDNCERLARLGATSENWKPSPLLPCQLWEVATGEGSEAALTA